MNEIRKTKFRVKHFEWILSNNPKFFKENFEQMYQETEIADEILKVRINELMVNFYECSKVVWNIFDITPSNIFEEIFINISSKIADYFCKRCCKKIAKIRDYQKRLSKIQDRLEQIKCFSQVEM